MSGFGDGTGRRNGNGHHGDGGRQYQTPVVQMPPTMSSAPSSSSQLPHFSGHGSIEATFKRTGLLPSMVDGNVFERETSVMSTSTQGFGGRFGEMSLNSAPQFDHGKPRAFSLRDLHNKSFSSYSPSPSASFPQSINAFQRSSHDDFEPAMSMPVPQTESSAPIAPMAPMAPMGPTLDDGNYLQEQNIAPKKKKRSNAAREAASSGTPDQPASTEKKKKNKKKAASADAPLPPPKHTVKTKVPRLALETPRRKSGKQKKSAAASTAIEPISYDFEDDDYKLPPTDSGSEDYNPGETSAEESSADEYEEVKPEKVKRERRRSTPIPLSPTNKKLKRQPTISNDRHHKEQTAAPKKRRPKPTLTKQQRELARLKNTDDYQGGSEERKEQEAEVWKNGKLVSKFRKPSGDTINDGHLFVSESGRRNPKAAREAREAKKRALEKDIEQGRRIVS